MELIPKKLIPTKICQTFSLAPSNEQNLQNINFANQNLRYKYFLTYALWEGADTCMFKKFQIHVQSKQKQSSHTYMKNTGRKSLRVKIDRVLVYIVKNA